VPLRRIWCCRFLLKRCFITYVWNARWPLQDIRLLQSLYARASRPFPAPPHLCCPQYCNTIARRLRNIRSPPPPPPLSYAIHHTQLVVAISSKGQCGMRGAKNRLRYSIFNLFGLSKRNRAHTQTHDQNNIKRPHEGTPPSLNKDRRWRDDGAYYLPCPGGWPRRSQRGRIDR